MAILNTFNIREKVDIYSKRPQKNLPNVRGENAAKMADKEIHQRVNNPAESPRQRTHTTLKGKKFTARPPGGLE